ncbi:MAG TPA: PepSY-associated TM helix domain-containing protein, partial [Oxalicibacterium sp.]|nr:PepSY-associated TM helix domain-containing protein [Oxalicibacterium sp.]
MQSSIHTSRVAQQRSLLWRIHFWAALIASPFALLAALTGMLYLFSPQIEQRLYAHLDHVQPRGERMTLDAAVDAARASMPPGATLNAVFPAWRAGDSVRVLFIPPRPSSSMPSMAGHKMHGASSVASSAPLSPWVADAIGTSVYVDPYSAQVLGTQAANARFSAWSKKLHSSLLQGEAWRWMIELAASWLMVMLLTGIWLWWPRRIADGLPKPGATGRRWWSQWHAFLGVALSIVSFVMLTTGLTWSKYAGNEIRWLRDATGQQSPQMPRGLHSMSLPQVAPMNWQQAFDAARR